MLQLFNRFPELAEFTDFQFHVGKTPLILWASHFHVLSLTLNDKLCRLTMKSGISLRSLCNEHLYCPANIPSSAA